MQSLADRGALTTDSASALLPPLPIDLGALPLGGSERRVTLRLANPGALPAAWELHSYDDPEASPGSGRAGCFCGTYLGAYMQASTCTVSKAKHACSPRASATCCSFRAMI
jgi:hypothetical protein